MTQIQTAPISKPEMLSIRAVSQRGVLPERALRRLVAQGKIPVVRSGKTMYINYTRLCEQFRNGEGEVWE